MADSSFKIQVDAGGETMDVESLVTLLRDTVGLLEGMDKTLSDDNAASFSWHVGRIHMESPLTVEFVGTLLPEKESGPEVVRPLLRGIQQLEKQAKRPSHFSDAMLVAAKRLVSVLDNGVARIEVSSEEVAPVRLTQHIAANVDEVKGTPQRTYWVHTELEGRLEQISIHANPEFKIYDPITNQPVKCVFDASELEALADCLKKRGRVRVYGHTKYSAKHVPSEVRVERFELLPEQADLPQLRELHEADINITGDMNSVDYVRALRHAE